MYEQISKDQFEEIMEQLTNESVWLDIHTEVLSATVHYEEFKFLAFLDEKYQLGFQGYDEENEYKRISFNQLDLLLIHRNQFAPTVNAEEIILTLKNDVKIFLRTENC